MSSGQFVRVKWPAPTFRTSVSRVRISQQALLRRKLQQMNKKSFYTSPLVRLGGLLHNLANAAARPPGEGQKQRHPDHSPRIRAEHHMAHLYGEANATNEFILISFSFLDLSCDVAARFCTCHPNGF